MSETGRTPFGTGTRRTPFALPAITRIYEWKSQSIERPNRRAELVEELGVAREPGVVLQQREGS